ncbi:MAG: hypothetical protein AVDCRST_MAG48-2242, partial [uncultured Friedmanniella sp.]
DRTAPARSRRRPHRRGRRARPAHGRGPAHRRRVRGAAHPRLRGEDLRRARGADHRPARRPAGPGTVRGDRLRPGHGPGTVGRARMARRGRRGMALLGEHGGDRHRHLGHHVAGQLGPPPLLARLGHRPLAGRAAHPVLRRRRRRRGRARGRDGHAGAARPL